MKAFYILLFFFMLIQSAFAATIPTQWQTIAPGIETTTITHNTGFPLGVIRAFRIDLSQFRLSIAMTHNDEGTLKTLKNVVIQNNAFLGINGGFFSPDLKPLGLRINNGKVLSPLKPISWWGVFYIKNNRAYIVSQKQFRRQRRVQFAIQSGPRLIVNGRIPRLKPGIAPRSALGITAKGKVVIAITHNVPMTTTAFAKLLDRPNNQGGLGCKDALNLDGGSSSQLYAQVNKFSLDIHSYAPVSDVVLVSPKKRL